SFASCNKVVRAKSSDTVPRQFSGSPSSVNVVHRIAVDPPQQKFLSSRSPKADAIDAFQTERNCELKPPRSEINQRYPVAAPTLVSASGATRERSQLQF